MSDTKCVAVGLQTGFEEFSSEYAGLCIPWLGSRASCSGNAGCSAGEACVPYLDLLNNDLEVGVQGACQQLPNPAGAGVGAACSGGAQCASGNCVLSPLTGTGYCTGPCLGGDSDCAGGTACRSVLFNGRDPATDSDDLRAGFCVQTTVGAPCQVNPRCRVCAVDSDCNPSQGVLCVQDFPAAPTGICRDAFGRCLAPCRHGCTPGGSDCPAGTSCVTVLIDPITEVTICEDVSGNCVRADLAPVLSYEHGMCGDPEFPLEGGPPLPQQDFCYYFGRVASGGVPLDVFACGLACGPESTCPSIPPSIATVCREVYEFSGAAFPVTQCAPSSAFVPQ